MAQIFISYSRSDRKFLNQFVSLIRKVYGNDSLWFDGDIYGGADWWLMILNEIEKCELFIYLISDKSLESPYCQAEFREALRLNKKILPVVVRRLKIDYPGKIEVDLADVLRRTHYINLSNNIRNVDLIATLYAAVNRLLQQSVAKSLPPQNPQPTPQPIVLDKKPLWLVNVIRLKRLGLVLMIGVIGFLAIALSNIWKNPASSTLEPLPTKTLSTQISVVSTSEPSGSTQSTNPSINVTHDTPVEVSPASPISTSLAVHTPTLSAEQIALTPVLSNAMWQPYITERDFDGVMMVLVPAGCFTMGNENGESDEQPIYEQCFDQPFWIDKYEVTNQQFRNLFGIAFQSSSLIEDDRPRERINWHEANDFCLYRNARLPTENEWEYAARGPDNLNYPWGYTMRSNRANDVTNSQGLTIATGSYPDGASWVGALDLAGNVWEWNHTIYSLYGGDKFPYPYVTDDGREDIRSNVLRVVRGGSFLGDSIEIRATNRHGYDGNLRDNEIGFRCAKEFQ